MAKIGNGDCIPKERWREGDGDQGKGVKFGLFTVFVDNLPSAMVAKTLFKLFSQFGIVKEVFIPLKRRTVSKSRFGFVRFNCPVAADIAIQKGNGLLVEERVLEVKKATKDRSIRFEQMFVNGKFCKDPKLATADDFFFHGLRGLRNTSNSVGSTVTPVDVMQIPGLNTLGISLVRIDYAPNGLIPPHMHPRASEILVVLEGTLYVGFVTSNTDNRLFTKVLYRGDVFVFPEGLIHFQFNLGKSNAVALAGLSSQNPGIITVANAVFGSNPKISADVLAKAFQVDKKIVDYLEAKFW